MNVKYSSSELRRKFNRGIRSTRVARELETLKPNHANQRQLPPSLGDLAPAGAWTDGLSKPLILCFLRHLGCPFAEWTVRAMVAHRPSSAAVHWALVSQGDIQQTAQWLNSIPGASELNVLIDAKLDLFGQWGLGGTSLAHFLGLRSLGSVIRVARAGIYNGMPSGSRWQQAGTFVVGQNGIVVWRHLPTHAGDLPDFQLALNTLFRTGAIEVNQVS